MDQNRDADYSLILGEAKQTFDLSTEPNKVRDAYNRNSFLGQSCLQARKLLPHAKSHNGDNHIVWKNLTLSPEQRSVTVNNENLVLNRKEFDLLYYFGASLTAESRRITSPLRTGFCTIS